MDSKDTLIRQLFIGKVASEIGIKKTTRLLQESYLAFKDLEVKEKKTNK
jgi:hypothetical protein